jgi:hypothetical protein
VHEFLLIDLMQIDHTSRRKIEHMGMQDPCTQESNVLTSCRLKSELMQLAINGTD